MPVRSREIHSLSSRIQLPVLRKLLSIMDGQHSALRHGRGWEFMDLAPYQAGDDVRAIDWPATVRTGSPVIKRREATANLQVMLVVDTGREMGALAPSGETKEEVALTACEAIAWLSVARGDQIGLVAGDSERVRFMPARSGNAHAETVMRRIEEDITLSSPHSDVPKLLARARYHGPYGHLCLTMDIPALERNNHDFPHRCNWFLRWPPRASREHSCRGR